MCDVQIKSSLTHICSSLGYKKHTMDQTFIVICFARSITICLFTKVSIFQSIEATFWNNIWWYFHSTKKHIYCSQISTVCAQEEISKQNYLLLSSGSPWTLKKFYSAQKSSIRNNLELILILKKNENDFCLSGETQPNNFIPSQIMFVKIFFVHE